MSYNYVYLSTLFVILMDIYLVLSVYLLIYTYELNIV